MVGTGVASCDVVSSKSCSTVAAPRSSAESVKVTLLPPLFEAAGEKAEPETSVLSGGWLSMITEEGNAGLVLLPSTSAAATLTRTEAGPLARPLWARGGR